MEKNESIFAPTMKNPCTKQTGYTSTKAGRITAAGNSPNLPVQDKKNKIFSALENYLQGWGRLKEKKSRAGNYWSFSLYYVWKGKGWWTAIEKSIQQKIYLRSWNSSRMKDYEDLYIPYWRLWSRQFKVNHHLSWIHLSGNLQLIIMLSSYLCFRQI